MVSPLGIPRFASDAQYMAWALQIYEDEQLDRNAFHATYTPGTLCVRRKCGKGWGRGGGKGGGYISGPQCIRRSSPSMCMYFIAPEPTYSYVRLALRLK